MKLSPLRRALLSTSIAAAIALGAAPTAASNYPPSYPFCSSKETRDVGPFWIQRANQNHYRGRLQLSISYHGYLLQSHRPEEIEFYLRINGASAFVRAQAGALGDAFVFLDGGPRACRYCADHPQFRDDEKCLAMLARGSSGWLCEEPSELEKQLLPGARSGDATYEPWDVEVAATAGGEWDSGFGGNYRAWFDGPSC